MAEADEKNDVPEREERPADGAAGGADAEGAGGVAAGPFRRKRNRTCPGLRLGHFPRTPLI